MSRPELGTKRRCTSCSTKFYDLARDPIVCPKCGETVIPDTPPKKAASPAVKAPDKPAPVAEPKAEPKPREKKEPDEPVISFEEADEETAGTARSGKGDDEDIDIGDDVEIEDDDDDDDDSLLADDEDYDEDVTDIIDTDIKEDD